MDLIEIRNSVLINLYRDYFDIGGERNLYELSETLHCKGKQYENLLHQMTKDGLISPRTAGGDYQITPYGVLCSEEQTFLPEEEKKLNQHIRTEVLRFLTDIYEAKGAYNSTHFEQFELDKTYDANRLVKNLYILMDRELIESTYPGSFKITITGLRMVEQWRKDVALINELDSIRNYEAHERGRAFQVLFAKLIHREGWEKQEGVRTESEEIDVIMHKGREFYLIECKWEKDPIQAKIIREFFGKLSHRININGIIVSMSGFTEGAVMDVKSFAGQKVILLFGPGDVKRIVEGREQFELLLNEKFKQMVTRDTKIFE